MMSRDRAAARFVELLDGPFLRAVTEPARLAIVRALSWSPARATSARSPPSCPSTAR
jgi:hypothetical protein